MITINDQENKAHEFLTLHPKKAMLGASLGTICGALIFGAIDFISVYLLFRQHFIGEDGNVTVSFLAIASVASVTLCGFFLLGWCVEQNKPWSNHAAVTVFGLLLALFAGFLVSDLAAAFAETGVIGTAGIVGFFDQPAAETVAGSNLLSIFWHIMMRLIVGAAFMWPGLMFCRYKEGLHGIYRLWRARWRAEGVRDFGAQVAQARTITDTVAGKIELLENEKSRIVDQFQNEIAETMRRHYEAQHRDLQAIVDDVTQPKHKQDEARANATRIRAWLESSTSNGRLNTGGGRFQGAKPNGQDRPFMTGLAALLLSGVLAGSAAAAGCDGVNAGSLMLPIDISGSTPARDKGFVTAVIPLIEQEIRAVPLCGTVKIWAFGEADKAVISKRVRVQAINNKFGMTRDAAARMVIQVLVGVPVLKDDRFQAKSELIGAYFDASLGLSAPDKGHNAVIMLSDGYENSPYARCDLNACKLPPPHFTFPKGTKLSMWGIGWGQDSRNAAAITQEWQQFFKRMGTSADLRRVL